ncbi:hypothetical protein B0H15DRAFT_902987 [Mycena belliarum]|uniref:RRM domain-containing protein n=1 Tax=Mycena belliarum TaxID=1033014 RepID=A0AAD6XY89_9AGAR|nr:hypothetical protein B0H15DRAFT_902987 [Mycena belliae]
MSKLYIGCAFPPSSFLTYARAPPNAHRLSRNLSFSVTDETLHQAFSQYGNITDSIVMKDRETGRSRGFGFVTYNSEQEASAAISAMNEQDLEGRRLRVNMANAKPSGGGGGGYGGGGGGYGGGGGGYGGGGYNSGGGGGYNSGGGGGYGGHGGGYDNQNQGGGGGGSVW